MASISTGQGDGGNTRLLYGKPRSKSDPRVEAYGTGDEAISALGLARAHCEDDWICSELLEIQRILFIVNAELATDLEHLGNLQKHFMILSVEHTQTLDDILEKLEQIIELPSAFIIPGASVASASLDVARTVVRRLERLAVGMYRQGQLRNHEIIAWLNRLSDCLFMMARYVDRDLPFEAVTGTRAKGTSN